MSTKSQKVMSIEELVGKFRERNQRVPRNAGELTQFCKQLRGIKPIGYGEARKYFQQQQETKKKGSRSSSSSVEEKQPEEETAEEPEPPTEASIYTVGDQVTLTKDRSGIIRFVGPVDFAEGTWYGIELHEQFVGKCDGSKDGKKYFECNPKRGIFVREDKIRRRMSRADHARKITWMMANAERKTSKLRLVESANQEETDGQEEPENTEQNEPTASEEKEEIDENSEATAQPPAEEDETENQTEALNDDQAVVDEPNDDEDLVVVNEPSETVSVASVEKQEKKRKSVTFSLKQQPLSAQPAASEYFPATEGQNILHWVANQSDLSLRSDLFDLYLNDATTAHLRMVFEDLKTFEDYEQQNLMLVDVMPRLCRDAI